MTFKVELAVYEDIEPLIDLYLKAFETDELYPYLYPNLSWDEIVQFESSGPKVVFHKYPWVKLYKVVEVETGKVVAWSRWHLPRVLTEEEKAMSGDHDHFAPIPPNANVTLCQDWFDKLEAAEHKYIDRENGFFINYLVTHPDYERRGLGRMLMRIGLDEADKTNRKVVLIATAKGAGLYNKLGFKEVDRISVDTRPYGGLGEVHWLCMRREPGTGTL